MTTADPITRCSGCAHPIVGVKCAIESVTPMGTLAVRIMCTECAPDDEVAQDAVREALDFVWARGFRAA